MALQFPVADIMGNIDRGRNFAQAERMRPINEESARLGVEQQQQNLTTGGLQREQALVTGGLQQQNIQSQIDKRTDDQKNQSLYRTAFEVGQLKEEEMVPYFDQKISEIKAMGGNPAESEQGRRLAMDGKYEAVYNGALNILKAGRNQGELPPLQETGRPSAEQQTFDDLIKDFSEEDKVKARRRKAGLDARAVGSAVQTIAQTGTAANIAEVESVISTAKEVGKLTAQLKLKPEVESAVIMAVGQAKIEVDKIGKNRSNKRALDVYTGAMSNLTKTLDNTITGPFIGLTPALTANAQIADGAIAMILPLLKDVFRGAGEGTFTEGDQKILTDLIPTRSTLKEARVAQIQMIDSIIRSKLSAEPTVSNEPLTEDEKSEIKFLREDLGLPNE
jgi:hypothetical protein